MIAVLGVDPGSVKAGYALVDDRGRMLEGGVVAISELPARLADVAAAHPVDVLALGQGTRAASVAIALAPLGLPIRYVDEFETSRRARQLYFADHPPTGWRRLIPTGLQLPPRAVDDYAALLIARRFLAGAAAQNAPK
jgi:RNase H-fold protein (predicted Holliday junction resolvase)